MRVAILSESSADEAALRILVDGILGMQTMPVATNLRGRGWTVVQGNLIAIAKFLHYRTDAEGLVVVVDSNHTYLSAEEGKNRLRDFQELVTRCRKQLSPVAGRSVPLKIAVGVAAPAIEGWWLCKSNPQISEAAWEKGLDENREPYSKLELKRKLYGNLEVFPLELMKQKMIESAHNLTGDLPVLERNFPNGFGSLVKELRKWRKIN